MRTTTRTLVLGAVAGLIGTATMSAVLVAAKGLGLLGEPPPKKLTRKILGFRRRGAKVTAMTVLTHLGYGAGAGILYALLPPRQKGSGPSGAAYGLGVWAASYMGWIPALGLMPPPSKDRLGRPTSMALAHVVYGGTLGFAFRALAARLIPTHADTDIAAPQETARLEQAMRDDRGVNGRTNEQT